MQMSNVCNQNLKDLLFARHADVWTSYAQYFHDIYQAIKKMERNQQSVKVKNWAAMAKVNSEPAMRNLFCAFRDTLIHYVPYLKQLHLIEDGRGSHHQLLMQSFESAVAMLEIAVEELAKASKVLARRNLRANLGVKSSIRTLLAMEQRRLAQLKTVDKTLHLDLQSVRNTKFAGPVQLYLGPLINNIVMRVLTGDGLTDATFKQSLKDVRSKVAPVVEAKAALDTLPYKSVKEKHERMQQLLKGRSVQATKLASELSVGEPFANHGVGKLHNETKGHRAIDPRALAFIRDKMYRGADLMNAEAQARNQLSNYTSYETMLRSVKELQSDVRDELVERVQAGTFRWPTMKTLMTKLSERDRLTIKNMPTLQDLPLPIFETNLAAVNNTLSDPRLRLHEQTQRSLAVSTKNLRTQHKKSRFWPGQSIRIGTLQAKNVHG